MIGEEYAMTVRENVHQLVDKLPEDRLEDALDYLAGLEESGEAISAATAEAIEEGLEDIRQGRTIPLEEYRRTRGL
jgi:adenine/guanine phosphoribosyltransferase-like PRPP-binding protein